MRSGSPATCITDGLPDPELIIRTSGELRLSQLSAVAVRLFGAVFLRYPVAGLRAGAIWTGPSWRISSVTAGSAG